MTAIWKRAHKTLEGGSKAEVFLSGFEPNSRLSMSSYVEGPMLSGEPSVRPQ